MAEPADSIAKVRRLTGVPAGVFSDGDIEAFLADTGETPSVNLACAELLDAWATRAAAETDFTADGASVSLSDKAPALRAAAKEFRRKAAGLRVATIRRGDE